MNLLLINGLPEEYKGIPISADFRNMIQVDLILREEGYQTPKNHGSSEPVFTPDSG